MHPYDASLGTEKGAAAVLIVNSIFNFATLVVVTLRYFSRKLTGAGLWWDDYLIFMAAILVNVMLVLAGFLAQAGLGNDTGDVQDELHNVLHLMVGFRMVFLLCICLNKLSAILFYKRVFVNQEMQVICKVLCALVVLWSAANYIQEFTVCQPLEAFFDGHPCPARKDMDIAVCFFNAFVDVLILLLPIRPIWMLQMRKKTKIALTVVFLLGLATTTIALLRFIAIVHTDYSGDMIGTAVPSIVYAILEPNLAILCLSLPMLQPLWHKFRHHDQKHNQISEQDQKHRSTPDFSTRTDYADGSFGSSTMRAPMSSSMSVMSASRYNQVHDLEEGGSIELVEHDYTRRGAAMPAAYLGP